MSPKPPDILRKSHRHAERDERAAAKLELRRELAEVAEEADAAARYHGSCACGAIAYVYSTHVRPADWDVRRCACKFCRHNDALFASDSTGSVELRLDDAAVVERQRLDPGTAETLVCRRCGDFVAAVTTGKSNPRAIINLRLLDDRSLPSVVAPAPPETDTDSERQRHDAFDWLPLTRPR